MIPPKNSGSSGLSLRLIELALGQAAGRGRGAPKQSIAAEVGSAQDCIHKIRIGQICGTKVRACQVRLGQSGPV